MTPQQQYKKGDKVIFKQNGSVLSAKKGRVFTFEEYHETDNKYQENRYFKVKELMHEPCHNFAISDVKLFNQKTDRDFVIVTMDILENDRRHFIEGYVGVSHSQTNTTEEIVNLIKRKYE